MAYFPKMNVSIALSIAKEIRKLEFMQDKEAVIDFMKGFLAKSTPSISKERFEKVARGFSDRL